MTPAQREAALRLADELQRFDGAERESLRDETAALLRELLAEPVINHKMTTEPAEPQGEPAMAAEIEGDCLVAWNASAYGHSKADTVHPMFLTAFTLGYRAAENATHPPQQRKPLSDEQIYAAISDQVFWATSKNFIVRVVRDVEAAHGITGGKE